MNHDLRIAQWVFPFLPALGGREIFTQRLTNTLVSRGHTVEVFAQPALNESESNSPFRIHRLPVREIFTENRANEVADVVGVLRERLANLDPDIVHIHTMGPEVLLLAQALELNGQSPQLIYTNHDLVLNSTDPRFAFFTYMAKKVDAITTISQEAYSALCEKLPALRDKMVLIQNGVPIPIQPPVPAPLTGSVFSFGRLSPEKGFDVLINAWARLQVSDRALVITGDGGELPYLKRLARSLGCESSVIFTGWLSEEKLGDQLGQCTFVVIPSIWNEPFGLVAAEAQAHGRAVIASNTGGLSEIVLDSVTGYLVTAGDVQALTDAMSSLLADPMRARLLGESGHKRAAENLDFEVCVDNFESLYEKLIGR